MFLIKTQFAVNSELFARVATLSRKILIIFTRHLSYAEISPLTQHKNLTNTRDAKAYHLGTHRSLKPVDTLNRVQPLLAAMGISRVANVTGLDRVGIPVY